MNYQAMVDSLNMRLGGGLSRITGANSGSVDAALTESQTQVRDDMVIAIGAINQPAVADEEGSRQTLDMILADIDKDHPSTLPDCYHQAVVIGAVRILARLMGDAAPTFINPSKLWQEYMEALNRGHKVYAQQLNITTPNRIQDGYAPDRHYEEDF